MVYSFISGGSGGLGKAFALELAKKGNNLFLTGRSLGKLSAVKGEIAKNFGVKIICYPCDLTSTQEIAKMLEYIDGQNIKFNKILNVAGVDTQKAFLDYTYQKLLFQIGVNVQGTVALTYQLLARRAEGLEILTVSSMSGVSPMPYFAVYSATKAMLTNLFTALHYELKPLGIKVTTVMPGGIPTRQDIIEDIKGQGLWGKLSSMPAEKVAEKSLKALKRNKIKYIPGFFNKLLRFIMAIAPKRLVLRFIAKRWKKQTKDAF